VTAAAAGPVGAVGFRSERGPILAALMLSTSLVALDSTIVATAVPSIVADLGGFAEFPWLFSVYLLAQAVSVPIANRSCCSASGCSCSAPSCARRPGGWSR
jgi:hypothetical protein